MFNTSGMLDKNFFFLLRPSNSNTDLPESQNNVNSQSTSARDKLPAALSSSQTANNEDDKPISWKTNHTKQEHRSRIDSKNDYCYNKNSDEKGVKRSRRTSSSDHSSPSPIDGMFLFFSNLTFRCLFFCSRCVFHNLIILSIIAGS